jgi:hypothetical protein
MVREPTDIETVASEVAREPGGTLIVTPDTFTTRMHRRSRRSRADAVKRPHDENVDSRARGRRNPPRIAARASLPDLLASDLDVPARGSGHAPARRGGAQIPRR